MHLENTRIKVIILIIYLWITSLFTTIHLLEKLEISGYYGTGTIRVNGLGKSYPLVDITAFKHSEKGTMRSMQTTIPDSKCYIKLIQWLDNKVVTLASSMFGTNPERKSKSKRKMVVKSSP